MSENRQIQMNTRTPYSISVAYIAAALMLLPACMTSKREEELNAQLKALEVRMIEMEKQVQVRDRTFDVVKNTTEESSRKVLTAKSELDEVRRQLSMTQGAIDELRVKMARVQEGATNSGLNAKSLSDDSSVLRLSELDDWQNKVEKRLTKAELLAKDAHETTGKEKKNIAIKNRDELAKMLSSAYSQKDYAKVIRLASGVIGNSTSEPMKTLAMEFRAEAQFQLRNYGKAALDLMEIIEKYPSFERKPRALLLAGDSCVYLKQLRAAKALYAECVRQFPDKEECKASKERLARLGV
ncbi:MAG: tetratricopeptide repeat protein [Silvanigrellaceae bacterium]